MSVSAKEYEEQFLQNLQNKTGFTLQEWIALVYNQKFVKQKEIVSWLKTEKNFNHAHAVILADIFLNGGKPVYADSVSMFNDLLKGKENQLELFEEIKTFIKKVIYPVELLPTKAYVSVRQKREFACIKINKKEIRLGMDLQKRPFTEKLVSSKSLGAMPRISHMVEITDKKNLNSELSSLLKEAAGNIK